MESGSNVQSTTHCRHRSAAACRDGIAKAAAQCGVASQCAKYQPNASITGSSWRFRPAAALRPNELSASNAAMQRCCRCRSAGEFTVSATYRSLQPRVRRRREAGMRKTANIIGRHRSMSAVSEASDCSRSRRNGPTDPRGAFAFLNCGPVSSPSTSSVSSPYGRAATWCMPAGQRSQNLAVRTCRETVNPQVPGSSPGRGAK